jgi:carbonic anhydrase
MRMSLCCNIQAGDKTYNLLQIHLHSSAEHLMSGYDYAAEAHLVHVNEDDPDDLKVIGVFLQLQAEIVFQVRTHVKTQYFTALPTQS